MQSRSRLNYIFIKIFGICIAKYRKNEKQTLQDYDEIIKHLEESISDMINADESLNCDMQQYVA
jgi:hypothetical protein